MAIIGRYLARWLVLAVLAAGFAAWGLGQGQAAEQPAPAGMTLLTVAGAVGNWNRGPVDERRDGFLHYHEIDFERALAFDREMLDGLEQGKVTAHPPQVESPSVFTGPTLAALLAAAGAEPDVVLAMALDGYAVELTREDREGRDWIVATAADGKPLPIGGAGPLWIVHTPADGPAPTDEEEQRWVWAIFYIGLE